ncbi:MAG: hypothetical protein HZA89_11010 [Verrucomicrobia bacterium]|nr:hypothetical protein [Verrucomicrobiota bacterium]
MKPILVAAVFGLALAFSVSAQPVQVEVVAEQKTFLPSETLTVGVRISNLSGQALRFGLDNDWLTFTVQGQQQKSVLRLTEMPVTGAFTSEPATHTTARFDLAPYFDLSQPGNYTVTATVRVPELGTTFSSPPKRFDITKGNVLWEQEFGVPGPPGAAPVIRKYALVQANHLGQLKLYVRVTESSGRVLKVYPLSPLVGSSRPEHQIDRESNLHVLNQGGAKAFVYCVVSPDGELRARHTYDAVSRVRLAIDLEGKFGVIGGTRRVTANDIPAPKAEADTRERPASP